MLAQVGRDSYDTLVVLAVVMTLLVNVFFLFKVVPWSRPGSWRLIWLLATVASMMFIVSEAAILTDERIAALDSSHQVPLFVALLAGAAGFFLVYTDAYRASERSRILALTDAVTDLPNRRAFEERLKVAYERRERFTLVYMDLDGFKLVNDRLGHAAGDDVLRSVAGVLRLCIRQADIAARVGGDEFALLLASADSVSARVIADRVLRGLQALSLLLPGGTKVGASFGIATDHDGADSLEVVAAADAAMYRAKRQGGDRIASVGPDSKEAPAAST
jgi:diguanylate cyclase (GGDEF)-like protein